MAHTLIRLFVATFLLAFMATCSGGGNGIEGTVTSGGNPVEGAEVSVFPATDEEADRLGIEDDAGRTTTDGDGNYSVDGLDPGDYSVVVKSDSCNTLVPFVTVKEGKTAKSDVGC